MNLKISSLARSLLRARATTSQVSIPASFQCLISAAPPFLETSQFRRSHTVKDSMPGDKISLKDVDPIEATRPFFDQDHGAHQYQIHEIYAAITDLTGGKRTFTQKLDLLIEHVASTVDSDTKTMADSFQVAWVRLSDPAIRERYINVHMHVRLGVLLEDLDAFSVWIGFVHNHKILRDPSISSKFKSPVTIVTASVDRIYLKKGDIDATQDVKLVGCVTWVGTSSMEVTIQLRRQSQDPTENEMEVLLQARFNVSARHPVTLGSEKVSSLKPEGPTQMMLFDFGVESAIKRKNESSESLFVTSPSAEESVLLHQLFLDTLDQERSYFDLRLIPDDAVWMEKTSLQNVFVTQPQERNVYHKIFGGYLMRIAYELADANATLFSPSRPIPYFVDTIIFRRSVDLGHLLFLSCQVVYSKDTRMQTRVLAESLDPKFGVKKVTNVFYFTFENVSGQMMPTVLPRSYSECMLYIDGRRHFKRVINEREKEKKRQLHKLT